MVGSLQNFRVDKFVADLAIKAPCVVASVANLTLSGEQTVAGVAVVVGDRVLVKDQSNSIENGIYSVETSAWQRTGDWDGLRDATNGTIVIVAGDPLISLYQLTSTVPLIIGTNSATFSLMTTLNLAALLGSSLPGEGASLVNIEDVNENYTAENVEAALLEVFGLIPAVQRKRKTADTSKANDGVLADDPHLAGFTLAANTIYKIFGMLLWDHDAGDIQMDFDESQTVQAGNYGVFGADAAGVVGGDMGGGFGGNVVITAFTDGQQVIATITGWIQSHATLAGTLDFRWAQNISNAAATVLSEGSYIEITPSPAV